MMQMDTHRADAAAQGISPAPDAAAAASAVKLVDVDKVYRTDRIETIALSGINLTVQPGEFISVMGPSGSGKSTLLNVMGLLDAPDKGTVTVAGQPITSYGDRKVARIRNETVGFIFQTFHLISDLRVIDNVEIPLLYRRSRAAKSSDRAAKGRGRTANRRALAAEALKRVGLGSRMDHFPSQLSGGQQQRVAIARAIVGRPSLLLADEPTGNLDSRMGGEIMDLLEGFNRDERTTIVMVTHDPRLAERTGRTVRLFDGRQVQ